MDHTLPIFDSQSSLSLFVDKEQREQEKNQFIILFLIEGKVKINIEDDTIDLNPSDIIVINKFQRYSIKKRSKGNLLLEFVVSDELLMQATEMDGIKFNCNSVEALDSQQYDVLRSSLHQIIEILLLKERRANFLLFSYVYQFLNDLISNFTVQTKSITKKDLRIREVIQYIFDHYYEEITLQSLAEKFYLEPSYFSKFFKKHVGVNFKEYIVQLRLDFAEKDLIDTDKAIARIAVDNGFSSVNSFNRAFKSSFGVTPSQFREETEKAEETKKETVISEEIVKRYKGYKSRMQSNEISNEEPIIINSKEKRGAIKSTWNELINVGRAEELLSDEMKEHILKINRIMDYSYIRVWSLFRKGLFTDLETYNILNFEKLDRIFDFLVENEMVAWLVLNKKDRDTSFSLEKTENWELLFTQFLEHVINRYGLKTVRKWKFELIIDDVSNESEVQRYSELFKSTKQILKNLSPDIELGGASFKVVLNNDNLKRIIEEIKGLEMDFYSFILFPYAQEQVSEKRNSQRIADKDFIINRLHYIKDLVDRSPKIPIYISEWNNTVSNKNIINDTLYKGAYIVKNIIDTIGLVDGIGYWVASDLYHSNPKTTQILNGGSGLLNKYGMPKSAMIGMRLFKEVNGSYLIKKDENILVCRIERGEILILGVNYMHPNQLYFLKNESEIRPDEVETFFPSEKELFSIKLKNLDRGNYEVRTYSCNSQNGSLFDKWKELGFIEELRLSDISYLEEKNSIHMELKEVEVKNKVTEIERFLEPNEFFTIHIRKKTRINH